LPQTVHVNSSDTPLRRYWANLIQTANSTWWSSILKN
jgi:hypothetical protein